ncbi:MAG: hypothetical protein ACRC2T_13475 [Thermoguttaceae bacterium]
MFSNFGLAEDNIRTKHWITREQSRPIHDSTAGRGRRNTSREAPTPERQQGSRPCLAPVYLNPS